jgi:hypothetical protein
MTARASLRKFAPQEARLAERRPAFHPPANDNAPMVSRRITAWVLMALGFAAAMAAVLVAGA